MKQRGQFIFGAFNRIILHSISNYDSRLFREEFEKICHKNINIFNDISAYLLSQTIYFCNTFIRDLDTIRI